MLLTDSKVVSFIQSSLERGNSKADIEQVLLKKGWSAQQVQEAISEAQNVSQTKSVGVKKSSNKIIVISIIIAGLLLISVGALLFLNSSGCSKNSDCDRGMNVLLEVVLKLLMNVAEIVIAEMGLNVPLEVV